MDLGAVVGFDGLVTSGNNAATSLPSASSDPQSKWYGSGSASSAAGDEQVGGGAGGDDWKKGMLSFATTSSSSYPSKAQKTCNSLPYFHLTTTASPRNSSAAGQYYPASGANFSFNGGGMMMMHGGTGGAFTPSQWMELEHQALIYKYLTSNVPVPLNLLIPIRKALESVAYSSFASSSFLRPNSLAWGPFHLGYSSSSDPEPGRCRRTDGKKWRCSRDAVPDQKYCERHINRGRHRSRKPVEVHSNATTNNTTATATAAATKRIPAATTTAASSAAAAAATTRGYGSSSSNLSAQPQNHHNNDLLASTPLGRMFVNKEDTNDRAQQMPSLSMIPASTTALRSNESSSFVMSKQHDPYAESSSQTEFGLVSSESLLNPSQKSSPLISCRSFSTSQDHHLGDQQQQEQHSLRQFMDNWPKTHQPDHHHHHNHRFGSSSSTSSHSSWQESSVDRTQLSISIPMAHNAAAADFRSSTSSPDNDKVNVQMGLGVGDGENQRQASNWIPISWEASMGGPLAEVLHNTNNTSNAGGGDHCSKNSSSSSAALNLMTEGWDSSPCQLTSSPTGVLQRTTFGSLSSSSAGSSPRTDNNNNNNNNHYYNNKNNSSNHCNGFVRGAGSPVVVHSSSLPAL